MTVGSVTQTVAAGVLVGGVLACARPPACERLCPEPARPIPRSAFAWEPVAARGLTLRVLALDSLAVLRAAHIQLTPIDARRRPSGTMTDREGRATVESLAPGRYVVAVRRIGYHPTVDTVRVAPDSGVRAAAVLARGEITFGCPIRCTTRAIGGATPPRPESSCTWTGKLRHLHAREAVTTRVAYVPGSGAGRWRRAGAAPGTPRTSEGGNTDDMDL